MLSPPLQKPTNYQLRRRRTYRPVEIILEGKYFIPPKCCIRFAYTKKSNVSVVIVADNDISILKPEYTGHAAIGTVLGCISKAAVNENIGWAEKNSTSKAKQMNVFERWFIFRFKTV